MAQASKILKRILLILFLIIFLIGFILIILITTFDFLGESESASNIHVPVLIDKSKKDSLIIKASTTNDTTHQVIRVSSADAINTQYTIDEAAGTQQRVFTGRRINVAVIGVDSRLGTSFKHADANIVVSFLIDNGKIEITAIPRDTPCDAMQEDSMQNKLTVLYPARGMNAYQKEVAHIAELDKIHYFIEVGFSQARGILELLGFKNSGSALQLLRSRSVLGGDDYQRCYNQAQFIRQMFLKHFDKMTGFFSEVLIRGGLTIVNSNMTYPVVRDLLDKLQAKGFPKSPDDIVIRIRPAINIKYKVYDFSDKSLVDNLTDKLETYKKNNIEGSVNTSGRATSVLIRKVNTAISDSASRPQKVITDLKTLFNQRAWLQIEDVRERDKIRDLFGVLLYNAYMKRGQPAKAKEIQQAIDAEKKLFSIPSFKKSVEVTDSNKNRN